MRSPLSKISSERLASLAGMVLVGVLAVAAWGFRAHWLPAARIWLAGQLDVQVPAGESEESHAGHDHGGHDDSHAGHEESSSLHLSEQARGNIGLTAEMLQPVKLGVFTRTLSVPARVVERPGRTRIQVASPMTGVVTAVHAVQGEAVRPGTLMFKVRLTHEDLVQAQTVFLKTLGELDVEDREIDRLTGLDERGVIAGKTLLERQYSKQKLQAVLRAHREALLLHGLSEQQIDGIVRERHLLNELEVRAPFLSQRDPNTQRAALSINHVSVASPAEGETDPGELLMVQLVNVHTGAMVRAGDALAVLADLRELYIEGRAFEHDADEITHAARMQAAGEPGWDVTAVRENNGRASETVTGLKIVYVDNEVQSESRAQRFFVRLHNQIAQDTQTPDGHRFLTWRFKPGQRMQLRVPVEAWADKIVLPVDAVAREGAERFVFQQNGDHFDRRPVQVEYQDQMWVVIANDGSLFPGDIVAIQGAHQMQVALKNKAGGGVDPHAGHNH